MESERDLREKERDTKIKRQKKRWRPMREGDT